ncbi:MAG: RNA polymerase sigma factor [Verrucomicrobia bacterium]|nr:RNA polymerase sigma factor [Verrucomicrobiota bacterium]
MRADPEFEKLVDLHYAPLYRFAFTLTRREDDACDLTQQTFWIWADKGHQLRDRTKVKSWLFTTLHREFLARHRKIIKMPEVEWGDEPYDLPENAPLPFECADHPAVVGAVAQIDEPFQAVIALFYLEDYTQQEIADILKVPLGTVKSRISRGIVQLQQLLVKCDRVTTRKEICG